MAANQLPGKRDIDRITLIVGRFAVGDFFDNNSYAKDPRADFMNWAMWSSAAYDFPADLPGYTRGAVVEFNRKDWAVRAGVFEVPSAPNSDLLVIGAKAMGSVVEFEERHTIFDQPGKLRLGLFANSGYTGNYNEALAIEDANPNLEINTVMASIRRDNLKYGFYLNAEQQIAKDIGLFARASWNDGQNEILSFTDIDRSISGGLSIKGSYLGTTERYHRRRRCDQWPFRSQPQLPRRRRPRPADRGRPAQLRHRTNSGNLLRLRGQQGLYGHRGLSTRRKSRL